MTEEKRKEGKTSPHQDYKSESEEVKEILGAVSSEVPSLIRGIIASVFSEEAGRDMGKAAAAFYKELKAAGLPETTAVRMTENYLETFSSLGDVVKKAAGGSDRIGLNISKKPEEKPDEDEE